MSMEDGARSRLSAQEARDWLGLPAVKPASSRAISNADSADVAGGRGLRGAGLAAERGVLHDSASVASPSYWEARAYSTPPLPSPASTVRGGNGYVYSRPQVLYGTPVGQGLRYRGNTNSYRGGVGQARFVVGGGNLPPPLDPFWNPVVTKESSSSSPPPAPPPPAPAPPPPSSSSLGLSSSENDVVRVRPLHPTGLSSTSLMALTVSLPHYAVIDRPALRGQEYKRERRRGRKPANYASAQQVAGSDAGAGRSEGEEPADDRWKFLGIRWPPFPPGPRREHSPSSENCGGHGQVPASAKSMPDRGFWDAARDWAGRDIDGLADPGVLGDEWDSDGRLSVWIDGSTELGKGLAGHTVYNIKVIDRAIGEQWTVLRRFRQFEALHQALLPVISKEPDASMYAIPPKELFGGRHGGVIAKRLKLLKVYIDRLLTCRAILEDHALSAFLELDPVLRGLGAYGRRHGPECVIKEGRIRVKEWKGPHKAVINILEAGLKFMGWTSVHMIVSPGPVVLVYGSSEDEPENPVWSLPSRRTIGSQVRIRRVDIWGSDLEKDLERFFLVSWEDISLLCQVESEFALESWAHAVDEDVDLRPLQSEKDRAKVDIELKAKETWNTRQEGLWGGL